MQQQSTQGFRLSPQQKTVWLAQQPGPAWCAQTRILIEGSLDPAMLQAALSALIDRHQILRTRLRRLPGVKTPVQYIAASDALAWQTLDLSQHQPQEREARLAELARAARQQPFDLEDGSLLRGTLVTLAADRHELIVTLPALAADGATLTNLLCELGQSYGALLSGISLDDEVVQYLQFSEWQNHLLQDEDAQAGRTHWQQLNLAALPPLRLPFLQKAGTGTLDEPLVRELPSALVDRLDELERDSQFSTAAILLAAWQTLLARLSGAAEVVVNMTVAGRAYEELEQAFGLFAKPVPLRSRYEAALPFTDLIRRVQAAGEVASEWQDYYVAEEHAAPGQPPIGFEFAAWPAPLTAGGLRFSMTAQTTQPDRALLRLRCTRGDNGLRAAFFYDPAALATEHVARIADSFVALLEHACSAPSTPLGALELLSAAARAELIETFNATTAAPTPGQPVDQLIAAQARRTPAAVALVCGPQQMSYAELNERANQLAHLLRQHGVGCETLVGICLERSIEMIVGLLAVLKAGGAYVPLDPDNPPARLATQLADSRPALLLTQERLADKFADQAATLICLDRDKSLIAQQPSAALESQAAPDQLAYLIYTSGSTGQPKGVAVTHGGLSSYTAAITATLELGGGLNFATVSTIAADLGNTVIFPALVSGGCLHLLTYELATDSAQYRAYMAEHQIDVLKIAPSHLRTLLASQASAEALPQAQLVLGGEALAPELLSRIDALGQGCQVTNHYGPTETTIGALTYRVARPRPTRWLSATVPIGRPLPNMRAYILDTQLRPVPIGVRGELYLSGAQVARGYLHQPAATAERFIPNPFIQQHAARDTAGASAESACSRLYRTGDLARWLPDGTIEFLGRDDDQVKIRSFRVELHEIEAALQQHPQLRAAVVVARADDAGDQQLVAYLTPVPGVTLNTGELRGFLREWLPDSMVPAIFATLSSLPLRPNGKVDRAALPDPQQHRTEAAVYAAPRNEAERTIAALWQELLHVERVGIHDNFFDLGGHSLLMVQAHSRLRSSFQTQLSIADLFKYPTVGALAGFLSQEQTDRDVAEQGQSRAAARKAALGQQRRASTPREEV